MSSAEVGATPQHPNQIFPGEFNMMMVELTSVPAAVLPIGALSDHLRLSSGFADDGSQDAQLETCLRSAMAAIEARINKALFQRQFVMTLMLWTDIESHPMPLAPIVDIEAITLISRVGDTIVADTGSYTVQPDAHRPRLVATGARLPAPEAGGSIEVTFTAGFSADWEGIPADLKHGLLALAAEFYNLRDGEPRRMSPHVMGLIEPYRQLRLRGVV
ncbi:head-tail connector protein [Gymnodinialimonas hymeniacidonis]|uniref:head-tail connector protein n=1 Tax=Gymnodinialimonas hymeniacidonis TaxID=3126508 RepID=UPI0034C5BDE6